MITSLRALFRTWTPWEEAVASAVLERLNAKIQVVFRDQIARVNKVQRIVGWREIDLYVMKNGKVDRGGILTFFDDREFTLAKVATKVGDRRIETSLKCIGGHLFSLESDSEVRSFAFSRDVEIDVIEIDHRFV